jgi:AcrR family transcriptional regulator
MNETVLTPERILEVAEEVLRRYGPAKATVVDVARALGVSHGSVYRHFPSKAALREAVAAQWLHRLTEPLVPVVTQDRPAMERLRLWFDLLIGQKQQRALDDPELFTNYLELTAEARGAVREHVEILTGQLAQIVADGAARGEFKVTDPAATGRAIFDATARFHNPAHRAEWGDPNITTAFEGVWALILTGLSER